MRAKRYPPMQALTAARHRGVVRDIFTTSSSRYDLLNHLLSFRRDVGWRRVAVERMRFSRGNRLLDVATGTADLAIAAAHRHPRIHVVGIDFAAPMLAVGRRKVGDAKLAGRIRLLEGDALALPFPDGSFDVSAMAFGMRNMPDKPGALREMARVTAPGGQVMVLEMTFAPNRLFRPAYGFYLRRILPRVARLFQRNVALYYYLGDSIRHFPPPHAFAALMRQAGLEPVTYHRLTFGTAYLHIGRTPGGG
ncbi:MAG: class I SAM-dependent methyltransferase [Spirochaetia bacterium]|jgi:demethylmenaquinone methyltransferase/2-methoxy-6-polyprenyl-1,4-benzoquinol methylase